MLHGEQWGPDNAWKSCPRQIIKRDAHERGTESAGSCAPGDLPGKSCNEDWGGVSQLLCLVDDIPSTIARCLWVENQLNATAFLLASWTHHWSTGRGISVVYRWHRENTPSDRNQVR